MNNLHMDQLPAEQLKSLLQEELEKERPDAELVRQLLQELEQRIEPAGQDRWQQFREEAAEKQRRAENRKRWLVSSVAILLMVCLLVMTIPGKASAESIWAKLARWTDSVFEFLNPSDAQGGYTYTTNHPGLQQVYDTVTELGVTQPVVPMWLPEEYELAWIDVKEQRYKTVVTARFDSTNSNIVFVLYLFDEDDFSTYAKDSEQVEVIERAGVDHYVTANGRMTTVTWAVENIECTISIEGREDLLIPILDSIYEMEAD